MKNNDNQTTPQIYYRPLRKWIEVTPEEKQNWERFIGATRKSKQRAGSCCIELTQKAQLAYEGQGNFSCGEWCRFCKAKAECRERAEANMALARYDFENPVLLDDAEIADILGKVDALTAWASNVKEYCRPFQRW